MTCFTGSYKNVLNARSRLSPYHHLGSNGTGLGALIGTGIYGGWWVGVQFGWWRSGYIKGSGSAI